MIGTRLLGFAVVIASASWAHCACARGWDNPDRDLTGFHKPYPTMAASLGELRKLAVRRTDFEAPVDSAEALRLVVAGAKACHNGVERTLVTTGYFQNTYEAQRLVDVERWDALKATAVGLGFSGPQGSLYFVVVAVPDSGDSRAHVYAYNRDDVKRQAGLVALVPIWLSGQTSVCKAP
jgi:hypothetical protein